MDDMTEYVLVLYASKACSHWRSRNVQLGTIVGNTVTNEVQGSLKVSEIGVAPWLGTMTTLSQRVIVGTIVLKKVVTITRVGIIVVAATLPVPFAQFVLALLQLI